MSQLPVGLSPEMARRMVAAVERVEATPLNSPSRRPRGLLADPSAGDAWIQVSSATVSGGFQDGNIYTMTNGVFGTAGLSIKVKQVNGYVLGTGKYFRAWPGGTDSSSGKPIYATDRQTGKDGSQAWCDNVTPTKTETYENGVVKTVV